MNKLKSNNEFFAVRNKFTLILKTMMKRLNKPKTLENNDKTNFTKLIDQLIERKIESNIGGDVVIVSMFVAKSVDS